MFEVGKTYQFNMVEGGGEVSFGGVVEAYEHPLIKLRDTTVRLQIGDDVQESYRPGRIINVTSVHFVGAVRRD